MDKATHAKFDGLLDCVKPFVGIWKLDP